ncbi:hypothetical protein DWB61_14510, partial [Ancylomarina euxinus]
MNFLFRSMKIKACFKLAILFFLSLFSFTAKAQLDTEHFVPPLYAGTNSEGDVGNHWVVFTTPSVEPISIEIYKGTSKTPFRTVTNVSITNPKFLDLGNNTVDHLGNIGTPTKPPLGVVNYKDLNKKLDDQALRFKSDVPFYVNVRHKSKIHGLSLTAKGRAALGTSFRSGHLYSKRGDKRMYGWGGDQYWDGYRWRRYSSSSSYIVNHRSHFISVMATVDGTEVTFSDVGVENLTLDWETPMVVPKYISVTLQAGESYVIGANLRFLTEDDVNDLNGTHITSNFPIAVNSGSWTGGPSLESSQDIGVDQIVPENLVGREYILLKGKGNYETERPIVVATKNNTNIYINKKAPDTPDGSEVKTLDAGDHFVLPASYYDAGNGVMFISSDQDIYLYQTTSASSTMQYATVGMNFIPPISSQGFRQVDIPFVNQLGTGVVAIYSQKGASVSVSSLITNKDNVESTILEGLDENDAQTVIGNVDWVVYKYIPKTGSHDVVKNVTVASNKAVYVALSTEDDAVGAAGYFSGFTKSITPIDPHIEVNLNQTLGFVCENVGGGLKLSINSEPDADYYEWYFDDINSTPLFPKQDLIDPDPKEGTKYILRAYYANPNVNLVANGDFSYKNEYITFSSSYDYGTSQNLEEPGSYLFCLNPEDVNTRFTAFGDKNEDQLNSQMLLTHSSSMSDSEVIWEKTLTEKVANQNFIFEIFGQMVQDRYPQDLNVYVNDIKINTEGVITLDKLGVWKSFKVLWSAGDAEEATISIRNANASGKEGIFALDAISLRPAIEEVIEYNPTIVPSYSYDPHADGLELCENQKGIISIEHGNMNWFDFSWEKQIPGSINFEPINDASIKGLDSYKLVIDQVDKEKHEGTYRCHISFIDSYSDCGIEAKPTSVDVKVIVNKEVNLESLSGETELCGGTTTEITAKISGEPSYIKWSVSNNTGLLETKENNSNVFTFNSNPDLNYGPGVYTVRCELINACSEDLFKEIDIKILGKAKLKNLIIPTNLCETKEITLEAKLDGDYILDNSTIEYSWYKNGESTPIGITNGLTYKLTPDINDKSYKVLVNTHYNFGSENQFTCKGNSIEETIVANPVHPEIKLIGLNSDPVCEGEPYTYKAKLETPSLSYTYKWSVPDGAKEGKTPEDFISSSFSFASVKSEMVGDYTVTVANNCGDRSALGSLVLKPRLLVTGVSLSEEGPYCLNEVVSVSVEDNGNASGYYAENVSTGKIIDPVNKSFDIKVDASTVGEWRVTALNSCGNKQTPNFSISLASGFTLKPIVPIKACVGDNVSLKAIVETPPVGLSYQWKDQAGIDIPGENNSSLEISNIKPTDAGEYTCVVSDNICSTKIAKGTLSVDDITIENLKPESVRKCQGDTYRFDIPFVGKPTFTWFFKGKDKTEAEKLGVSTSFYEIKKIATSHEGLYYCVVKTSCGDKRFEQTLNVTKNVEVSKVPLVDLNICEGESTELGIIIDGSPKSIQWFKDGVLLDEDNKRIISTEELVTAGTYEYKYIVDGDCFDLEGVFEVIVHDKPSITLVDHAPFCEGDIPLTMKVTGGDDSQEISWLNPSGVEIGTGLNTIIEKATYLKSVGSYTAKLSTLHCKDITRVTEINIFEPISIITPVRPNVKVCFNNPLDLVVDGKGADLSYEWYKSTDLDNPIHIGKQYHLDHTDMDAQGDYICKLLSSNDCDELEVIIHVDVQQRPTFSIDDFDACSNRGPAIFDASATGEGDYKYKWYRNDETNALLESARLEIVDIEANNGNNYHCKISDDVCGTTTTRDFNLTVKGDINIYQDPENRTVAENGSTNFTVAATGTEPIEYQWLVDKNDGAGFESMENKPASAQARTLSLVSVPFSYNGYKYRCRVSNDCTSDNSEIAILSVTADNRISLDPENAEICIGDEFTFVVEYNNTTDGCVWQYREVDTDPFKDVTAAIGSYPFTPTKSTLAIISTTIDMSSWTFRALVKRSGYVDDESKEVSVIVHKPATFTDISPIEICKTSDVSFEKKKLTGTGTYSYEWKKGSTVQTVQTSILNLIAADDSDGNYSVQVSDGFCNYPIDDFKITHYEDLQISKLADVDVICLNAPKNLVAKTDYIDTDITDPLIYLWKKDNIDQTEKSNTLNLSGILTSQTGLYQVFVSDGCTTKSLDYDITVLDDISLTTKLPSAIDLCENEDLNLSVEGHGVDLSYAWYKTTKPTDILSFTNKLNISNVKSTHSGDYVCKLTTASGCSTADKVFIVNVRGHATVSPLSNITVCEDELFAEFTVIGTAVDSPSYQWYNSNDIALTNTGDFSGVLTSTLKIENVLTNENKSFYCVVNGDYDCNPAKSNAASLFVNRNVIISKSPMSQTVAEMGTASFTVESIGTGPYSYQWFKDGVSMEDTPASAKTKTLELTNVPLSDTGSKYHCVVDGACDPATSGEAILIVTDGYRIILNPENAEICIGGEFTFAVEYDNTTDGCVWQYREADTDPFKDVTAAIGSYPFTPTKSTLAIISTTIDMSSWTFRALVKRSGYVDDESK